RSATFDKGRRLGTAIRDDQASAGAPASSPGAAEATSEVRIGSRQDAARNLPPEPHRAGGGVWEQRRNGRRHHRQRGNGFVSDRESGSRKEFVMQFGKVHSKSHRAAVRKRRISQIVEQAIKAVERESEMTGYDRTPSPAQKRRIEA